MELVVGAVLAAHREVAAGAVVVAGQEAEAGQALRPRLGVRPDHQGVLALHQLQRMDVAGRHQVASLTSSTCLVDCVVDSLT